MKPFWHPLSALVLPDPPVFLTPNLLRLLLKKGGTIDIIYAGDRMAPALRHGAKVRLQRLEEAPRLGEAVVACPSGIPDLLRVTSMSKSMIELRGDADPSEVLSVSREALLASARLPEEVPGQLLRFLRRYALDLREAVRERHDPGEPAATVRLKYDTQASFYATSPGKEIEESLLESIRQQVASGGRVLVAGSGSGRECFALARQGYEVVGVDFSPTMVETARSEARRRNVEVDFRHADLRLHCEPAGSYDCILFTYDVYSFISDRQARIDLLQKMSRWLAPNGRVFLSARRVRGGYDRALLTLQWMAGARRKASNWGASHTRWIAMNGTLHRSFINVFTERQLQREAKAGGFEIGEWKGGHAILSRGTTPSCTC